MLVTLITVLVTYLLSPMILPRWVRVKVFRHFGVRRFVSGACMIRFKGEVPIHQVQGFS